MTRAFTSAPFSINSDDQVEDGAAIHAVLQRPAVEVESAELDRGPQSRPPPLVHGIWIRSAAQQELRDVGVIIGERHQQRRDAVGVAGVHVGADFDEEMRRLEPAVASWNSSGVMAAGSGRLLALRGNAATDDADSV